jgi:hypothetical protein
MCPCSCYDVGVMKRLLGLIILVLFMSGCGNSQPEVVIVDDVVSDTSVEVMDLDGYVNTAFGYQFSLPEGVDVYGLTDRQTAGEAQVDSSVVFMIVDETNLFTIRGIEDDRSVHEWLSQEFSFFYPTGEAAQHVAQLGGEQAIYLTGGGSAGSPARVIVSKHKGQLIVISLDRSAQVYEDLIEGFVFF